MKTTKILKDNKKWLIIFAITLFLFWGLSILTNYCQWAYAVWAIIAFPFAPLWLVFENYCLSFNTAFPNFSHPLNDEIVEILLFLLFIIAQTSVYYWLYNNIVRFFKK